MGLTILILKVIVLLIQSGVSLQTKYLMLSPNTKLAMILNVVKEILHIVLYDDAVEEGVPSKWLKISDTGTKQHL